MGLAGLILAVCIPVILYWYRLLRQPYSFDWMTSACAVAGTCFILHCLVDFDFHIIGITIPALLILSFGIITPERENYKCDSGNEIQK